MIERLTNPSAVFGFFAVIATALIAKKAAPEGYSEFQLVCSCAFFLTAFVLVCMLVRVTIRRWDDRHSPIAAAVVFLGLLSAVLTYFQETVKVTGQPSVTLALARADGQLAYNTSEMPTPWSLPTTKNPLPSVAGDVQVAEAPNPKWTGTGGPRCRNGQRKCVTKKRASSSQ